ncbi:hypothetical protein T01_2007 [Trichinella spiralis]|uniref:Uncharacterized protein n=1 Tax=Trichinella spiralis TaxID=6334 RepID=A0A0V1BMQ8_TRISP|nr:hypothetical protein T01_2007 [Trichinella spiralis]
MTNKVTEFARSFLIQCSDYVLMHNRISKNLADVQLRINLLVPQMTLGGPILSALVDSACSIGNSEELEVRLSYFDIVAWIGCLETRICLLQVCICVTGIFFAYL